ncbi:hypothetical protein BAE44_0024313 [Dichanthelium oligosanthes]|uniref:RRM domain-containing protein n=1 Tax=Dichanthelium oligosanthes TaxID=888268 RepID=A0A1E5UP70_9POAL|nr:hypothetical protein BAE44_0024313 [Dichanthelium oligosanthes]
MLRNPAISFRKLFNRTTASSSACSSKLFVGGIVTIHEYESKVICHPTTGKSKGFGFVMFSSENEAAAAVHKMNGEASAFHYLCRYFR